MWHVVNTAPSTEVKVCGFLALHGIESYAPEFSHPRGTRPGSVRDGRHRWIFPGYVFFRAPAGFADWHLVHWAPGVRRLLRGGTAPAVMDDAVLEELRRRLDTTRPRHQGAGFQSGQRVRVDSGALAMIDAVFDRCLGAPDRVRILVQLLGRQIPVDVNVTILSAAS
jgi:transcription antitermination factor NusG